MEHNPPPDIKEDYKFYAKLSWKDIHKFVQERMQIHVGGMNKKDISYMLALSMQGGRGAVKRTAQMANIPRNTAEEKVEPFLIRKGYLMIESKRELTERGLKFCIDHWIEKYEEDGVPNEEIKQYIVKLKRRLAVVIEENES